MSIDLVIFDCDGVLIDSEVIACRVDAEQLTLLGIPMSTEQVIARFAGVSNKDMRALVEHEHGIELPTDYDKRVAQLVDAAMARELKVMPGVQRVLERLRVRYCIASSSTPERLRYNLGLTGLYDLFAPNIFSSMQVARGKPAPDLFLFAADAMGTESQRCLVVEDSVAGVQAAKAAGMRTIGFVGGGHCGADHRDRLIGAGADGVIDSLDDLPSVVAVNRAAPQPSPAVSSPTASTPLATAALRR